MSGIPLVAPYKIPVPFDLSRNVAPWNIDSERAVLLIHDMQHYFMQPFNVQHRKHLIEKIVLLCERARKIGVPVAYSAQPGGMSPEQRGLLKDFWGEGMRDDPSDKKIVEELAPVPGDWILTKWRYSAFFRSGLLERMHESGRDQLVICGVYAHVGVLLTAAESFTNDIQTFLVADAVADFTESHHRSALEYAAQHCAVVCAAEDVFI